jgi:hypothetical protein
MRPWRGGYQAPGTGRKTNSRADPRAGGARRPTRRSSSLQPQIFRRAELGVAGAAFIVRMIGHCCSKASVRFRFSEPREILFDCAT